jgi:AcrR family transcriptional regulator
MSMAMHDATASIVTRTPGPAPFLSREQILDATAACFEEAGYDGTTIRAIASRLRCSVGSIYRYFRDKRQLLLACGERAMRPVVEELADSPDVESSLRSYVRQAARAGELYRLQFWLASSGGHGAGVPAFVTRLLEGWGERLGDPGEAQRRWATVHGLMMLGWTPDQIVARLAAPAPASIPPQAPAAPRFSDSHEDMTLL